MSKSSGSTNQSAPGTSTPAASHALPARPPPALNPGFSFKPRNVSSSAQPKPTPPPQVPAYQYPSTGFDVNAPSFPASTPGYGDYTQRYGGQQAYPSSNFEPPQYGQSSSSIKNPFAAPSAGGPSNFNDADVEFQQQMQQWQANYGQTLDNKGGLAKPIGNANTLPLKFNRLETSGPPPSTQIAPIVDARKTVVREGGGQKWEDSTLLEWGNHHRLFIGNLAGEVTDDSLLKAFSKYPSVQKARVVRDKRTTKSKGFGFVSFSDADEYFQAAKDMSGKYIGSHPVLIRRAETEIKASNKKSEQAKYKNNKSKNGGGAGNDRKNDALGVQGAQGVQKKGKVDSKYKVLG